jgi:hypothetical protein
MLGRGIARCPTAGSLGSTSAPAVCVQSLDSMLSEQVTEDEAQKQKGGPAKKHLDIESPMLGSKSKIFAPLALRSIPYRPCAGVAWRVFERGQIYPHRSEVDAPMARQLDEANIRTVIRAWTQGIAAKNTAAVVGQLASMKYNWT